MRVGPSRPRRYIKAGVPVIASLHSPPPPPPPLYREDGKEDRGARDDADGPSSRVGPHTRRRAPASPLPRTPIDRRDDSSPPTEHPPPPPPPLPPQPAHPAASVAAIEVRLGCRPPPRSSRHFIKTASEFHARAIKASRCGDAESPGHCIGLSAISVIFCHSLSSDQLIDAWQLRGRTIHTSTLLCWQLLLRSWAELTSGWRHGECKERAGTGVERCVIAKFH